MSCGKQRFSEVMDNAFGTGRDAAAELYQSIVDDFATSGLALPTKDSDPTQDTVRSWVESSINYAKKIKYGNLVLGLVKTGATLGVGYIAISAAAAISVETAGVLVAVLVVFAFLCCGLPFLYDVLKSWKDQLTSQFEQAISGQ